MKILGLDLGIASIGWALINEKPEIIAIGSRIIPIDPDNKDDFEKGNPNGISKNADRTMKRSIRRGNFRYKLRRQYLVGELIRLGMMPDSSLFDLKPTELFALRDKVLKEKLSLQEIGRIFYQLNQKRGYKSSRKEEKKEGQKETAYLQNISEREKKLNDRTIGQFFFNELQSDYKNRNGFNGYRIKEQIFSRDRYIDEFNRIWDFQKQFYTDILTEENKKIIRDEIIYHQRPLKSQKGLVSICEFEGKFYKNKEGKEIFSGPKVAPRSSPLFQICKIWESVNNISLKKQNKDTKKYESYTLSPDEKQAIFERLNNSDKLLQADLLKILGFKKDEVRLNSLISKKGLQGNLTKSKLLKILPNNLHHLLQFDLEIETYEVTDKDTGEITTRKRINATIENSPLYQLWHCIYSIPDEKNLINTLKTKFSIPEDVAKTLTEIDFTNGAFGNKSSKAIRNILPYLQDGFTYYGACLKSGYNHSDSITKEENLERKLKSKLCLLPKNSLRQPIVEKILNQTINLINAIIEQYGKPDEIRIELARELKQSREDRLDTYWRIDELEKNHDRIRKLLEENPEFKKKKVSRRDIERYKLWEEFDKVSPYEPNKIISLGELYSGEYDIEHILPRSVIFDDSFSNKTICPHRLNSGENAKNKMTAFDFMGSRSKVELDDFLACVKSNKKISKTKRDKLMMSSNDISPEFIERQLRETQYISRKAREIILEVCREVNVTSGKITAHLRNIWGWSDVLMELQVPKYREIGLVETEDYESDGQIHSRERIIGWSKRDDHRHHAIDALSVACTKQGFIQRINTLNTQHTKDEIYNEVKGTKYNGKLSLLDKYLINQKPFTSVQVEQAASNILISFKSGKKVITSGKRKIKKDGKRIVIQDNIIIPRGALSEESVYGKIKSIERSISLKKVFDRSDLIVKPIIKELVKQRLVEHNGDSAKAFKSLKKEPLMYKGVELTYASIFTEGYVLKYPVQNIAVKDLEYVVDKGVRGVLRKRLALFDNKPTEAYKDLANNPIWLNEEKKIPIKTVRCFTGLDAVEPIKVTDTVNKIDYEKYVKPGNNHHIAIYKDENGNRKEHVVTFWQAVERKKNGIEAVIKNPKQVWDKILLNKADYNDEFLSKLPLDQWTYEISMQQNEMFIFNLTKEEIENYIQNNNYEEISNKLYRVQKLGSLNSGWWFRHHLETSVSDKEVNVITKKKTGRVIVIQSLDNMNGIKVKLNNIGQIIKVGE